MINLGKILLLGVLVVGCTDDDSGGGDPSPEPEDEIVTQLRELGSDFMNLKFGQEEVAPGLIKLRATSKSDVTAASCLEVGNVLTPACHNGGDFGFGSCVQSVFFFAHETPRCAVRLSMWNEGKNTASVYAFDLDGTASEDAAENCGNGIVDDGEVCDDGNNDNWDGCDSHCFQEPFSGCEQLIQDRFEEANIATIDKDGWDGPLSHAMVQASSAKQPMDATLCDAAWNVANATCVELNELMPFIGGCWVDRTFAEETCSLRMNVNFSDLSPETGVYSVSLSGILAITLD